MSQLVLNFFLVWSQLPLKVGSGKTLPIGIFPLPHWSFAISLLPIHCPLHPVNFSLIKQVATLGTCHSAAAPLNCKQNVRHCNALCHMTNTYVTNTPFFLSFFPIFPLLGFTQVLSSWNSFFKICFGQTVNCSPLANCEDSKIRVHCVCYSVALLHAGCFYFHSLLQLPIEWVPLSSATPQATEQ